MTDMRQPGEGLPGGHGNGRRSGHGDGRRRSRASGSPNRLGQMNRRALLRELRVAAPLSRVALAKRTGISKPAVTRGISDLIEDGLAIETGRGESGTAGGKRPTLLNLNPAAAAGLACMLEDGCITAALAGFDGTFERRATREFDPESDAASVIAQLVELLGEVLVENPPERPLLGIGLCVPGVVDERGRVIVMPRLAGWKGVPLAERLEAVFGVPVVVDAESRVQTLAEGWLGQGRDVDNFVCLTTGHGLAAGIVLNRRLWRGMNSLAGEVGHSSTYSDGARCYCDSHACWEVHASTTRLLHDVRTSSIAHNDERLHEGELTVEDVAKVLDAEDPTAVRELDVHADALARGICNLVVSFDPERIIVHGESTVFGERLRLMITERVRRRFELWLDYDPPIVFSELGRDVGLAGAVSLALRGAWGLEDVLDPFA